MTNTTTRVTAAEARFVRAGAIVRFALARAGNPQQCAFCHGAGVLYVDAGEGFGPASDEIACDRCDLSGRF